MLAKSGGIFDLESKKTRLQELNYIIESNPNFWNDPKTSSKVLKEKKDIEASIQEVKELDSLQDDLDALQLAKEDDD